mgnify:CR=1 FL=1
MNMIKVLKTDEQYEQAMQQLMELMDSNPKEGSDEANTLELLALVIENFEEQKFPIDNPDPIEAIKFRMEQEGLTQKDLVPYIGSLPKVSEVLNGKRKLSLNMVKKLSNRLGISADILIATPMDKINIDWMKFPLSEMRKRGFFKTNETLPELKEYAAERVLEFLDSIPGARDLSPIMLKTTAHYRCNSKEIHNYALWAWQARILQLASQFPLHAKYKKGTVNRSFMRGVSQLSWSDNGPIIAKEFLNKHGIHLVIEPHFKQTYLDGAVCHDTKGNPIIALTLRYDRLDNFWFSLMHELAHIALHFDGEFEWFLDEKLDQVNQDPKEEEADKCATDSLIPHEKWESTVFDSVNDVFDFANELSIHPSIVIGRLRRERWGYTVHPKSLKIAKVRHFFID